MQTDEQQNFRFNRQVAIILAVTALALIIPLAGVGLLIEALLNPKAAPAMAQPEPPFRQSLEDLANQKFGPAASLSDDQNSVAIDAKDVDLETARVEGLAKAFGGFALLAEKQDGVARLTIQLPANQTEAFLKACRDPQNPPKPTAPNETRALVEVVIKLKAS